MGICHFKRKWEIGVGIVHLLIIIWVSGVVKSKWEIGMGIVHVLIIIWVSGVLKRNLRN